MSGRGRSAGPVGRSPRGGRVDHGCGKEGGMSSRSSSIAGASAALAAAAVVLILAAPGRGLAATQCARYAGTPQKQTSGGDFSHDGVETIYAAAQAYYCPDGAAVQITECLERLGDD